MYEFKLTARASTGKSPDGCHHSDLDDHESCRVGRKTDICADRHSVRGRIDWTPHPSSVVGSE
jgi:hypothetical protein